MAAIFASIFVHRLCLLFQLSLSVILFNYIVVSCLYCVLNRALLRSFFEHRYNFGFLRILLLHRVHFGTLEFSEIVKFQIEIKVSSSSPRQQKSRNFWLKVNPRPWHASEILKLPDKTWNTNFTVILRKIAKFQGLK